jgi:hypothetical protein
MGALGDFAALRGSGLQSPIDPSRQGFVSGVFLPVSEDEQALIKNIGIALFRDGAKLGPSRRVLLLQCRIAQNLGKNGRVDRARRNFPRGKHLRDLLVGDFLYPFMSY